MDIDNRKRLPPYVSYRTFRTFIDRLQQRMPARIDRSYWGDTLSGSTGTQLMAALRFLNLIDGNGRPSGQLNPLVFTKGEAKAELFKEIFSESFDFVLEDSFALQNATYGQLQELFSNRFQLTDAVNRKCIKFFIALAGDAGITLSPFITRPVRTRRTTAVVKIVPQQLPLRTNRNLEIPGSSDVVPDNAPWIRMLLAKFPAFDPTWSDEIKLSWFKAFDELLKRDSVKSE